MFVYIAFRFLLFVFVLFVLVVSEYARVENSHYDALDLITPVLTVYVIVCLMFLLSRQEHAARQFQRHGVQTLSPCVSSLLLSLLRF